MKLLNKVVVVMLLIGSVFASNGIAAEWQTNETNVNMIWVDSGYPEGQLVNFTDNPVQKYMLTYNDVNYKAMYTMLLTAISTGKSLIVENSIVPAEWSPHGLPRIVGLKILK